MKVLTAPEFISAVEKLSKTEQRDVYRLFEIVSQLSIKDLFKSSFVQVLVDKDEKRIFMLRSRNTRLLFSIEKIEGTETAIFIELVNRAMPQSSIQISDSIQNPLLTLWFITLAMAILLGSLWILTKIVPLQFSLIAAMITIAVIVSLVVWFTLGLIKGSDVLQTISGLIRSSTDKEEQKK